MRILVVEDDPAIVETLNLLFSSYHYAVDTAPDGQTGLEMAEGIEYDLVMLDVLLPGLDGLSLCQTLRADGYQMPILLLTGQGGAEQKAIALNMGADDYVVKPFDAEELIARVQALLRRGGPTTQPILSWGNLSVDPSYHRVSYGTVLLTVTPKEYAILELFLRQPGATWSMLAILNHGWPSLDTPGEESIRVHIKELRRKLTAVGAPKDFIKTVHGVGYKLNPLYCDEQTQSQLTVPQTAELKAVNQELRSVLEQLRSTQAELEQKNQELQATQDQLEQKISERTAELMAANQLLRQQQQQHRILFDSIDEGVCLFERLPLRPDGLRDYRCLAMNPVIQTMFGIPDLSGQSIRDNFCDEAEDWYDDFDYVLETGESIRFEREFKSQGLVIEMFVTCVEDETGRRLLAVMRDVTQRKYREANAAFLAELTEEFSRLCTPSEIMQTLGAKIGAYFDVCSCVLATVDEAQDQITVEYSWSNPGDLDLTGVYQLSDYITPEFQQAAQTEQVIVVCNTQTDPRTESSSHAALNIHAFVSVPFLRQGQWVSLFAVDCSTPRAWQEDEIKLIYAIAQRTFPRIERARIQIALQESEQRYRCLAELTPQLVWIADTQGHNTYVSPQLSQYCGIPAEQLLGFGWHRVIHPDDVEPLHQRWMESVQTGRPYEAEYRLRRADGAYYWHFVRGVCFHSEQGLEWFGASIDITDRKRSEQALKESQQQLQAILDNAPVSIYMVDSQNKYLLVNRCHSTLFSIPPEQIIGQTIYDLWPQEIADVFAAHNRQVIETGQLLQTEETAPYHGIMHTHLTTKFPIYDSTGAIYAVCGFSTNITEKKQLEAQLNRAQRLESLGALASGIAHDLNNVLTPILTITQLIRLTQSNLDSRSQEMLEVLESSAKRGADMVKQIMTFARGTDGKRIPLQISYLLQDTVNLAKQTFPKSISISKVLPEHPLWLISADPSHLHQILMNLCVNARDAMPEGGMLTLSAQNCAIDASAAEKNLDAKPGNYVLVTVSDTGIGIPTELRDRIFEPFFTTKPTGKGTGLGLSTSLGIIKSYGGFLQVVSEVGRGTQINLYLPVVEGEPTQSQQSEELRQGNGELVLIVDDEQNVQVANQALLESYGYKTLMASDGQVAVSLYAERQCEIKLVLIDLMMPRLNGVETMRRLQQINPQIKMIAISGLSSQKQAALSAGAHLFLTKPYTSDQLLSSINTLITKS